MFQSKFYQIFFFLFAVPCLASQLPGTEVVWTDCSAFESNYHNYNRYFGIPPSLHSKNERKYFLNFAKENSIVTQCANVSVPLNYDDPSQGSIISHMTRIFQSALNESLPQLWLLNGGPGGDGTELVPYAAKLLTDSNFKLTLYLPDHRGTGLSSPPTCPSLDPVVCAEYVKNTYGDKIKAYTVSNAARDLLTLMKLMDNNTSSVPAIRYLYGVSYGTYWANRFLQIASDNFVSAVILDGICPSDECRLSSYNYNFNIVGVDLMSECETDEFCSSQFHDADPLREIIHLKHRLDSQEDKCGLILNMEDSKKFSNVVSWLIGDWYYRVLVPPIVFRFIRCSDEDQKALMHFFSFGFEELMKRNTDFAIPQLGDIAPQLGNNIIFSEMWTGRGSEISSCEALEGIEKSTFFMPSPLEKSCVAVSLWPKYEVDEYYNLFAKINVPLLMLNGNLDPQTPLFWAQHAYATYSNNSSGDNTSPLVSFVEVPRAPHCVWLKSPTNNGNISCGSQMMLSFLLSPNHEVDVSCLGNIRDIDWKGVTKESISASSTFLGTPSMWG